MTRWDSAASLASAGCKSEWAIARMRISLRYCLGRAGPCEHASGGDCRNRSDPPRRAWLAALPIRPWLAPGAPDAQSADGRGLEEQDALQAIDEVVRAHLIWRL
jgi:hypothetical protein